jgi:uncharacterized membrane protein
MLRPVRTALGGPGGGRRVGHPLLLVALLGLALLWLLTNLAASSLSRLGLSEPAVLLFLAGAAAGSTINVPVWRRRITQGGGWYRWGLLVFYRAPAVAEQVLAINVGGAILPAGLSAWLIPHTPVPETIAVTLFVTVICFLIARPVPGVGITMPVLLPPVAAALAAWFLVGTGPHAVAVAYVGGSLGTLLGADILHLPRLSTMGAGVLSIGGAGVFDGVFLVGLVAVLLA